MRFSADPSFKNSARRATAASEISGERSKPFGELLVPRPRDPVGLIELLFPGGIELCRRNRFFFAFLAFASFTFAAFFAFFAFAAAPPPPAIAIDAVAFAPLQRARFLLTKKKIPEKRKRNEETA
tara:strand:+ start:95 stop:469 length:375 start_codon:yes stop_codon:yes gene_type:complete